ncbi:vasopressin-neurophysin 2-copeptin [Danio aesculapii]|uniref:vasopressin-neurophysin 2-copeptin n=1 Tax=Danio aesculapii TaxID=1142201 RepID=UPI0024C07D9A|nr:vasopressin-neurophysin 2-copeptin [Danio aesculapii]
MSDSLLSVCVLCVLALSTLSSACYIQNCPRGGKRSQPEPIRQCMSCGPGGVGRCFGPSICCGPGLGCVLGSTEAQVCMEEEQLSGPCETGGTSCGDRGGRCAAEGICCDSESCAVDPDCPEDSSAGLKSVSGETLLRLLNLATRRQRPF